MKVIKPNFFCHNQNLLTKVWAYCMNVLLVQACICLGPAICLFSLAHIQQIKITQWPLTLNRLLCQICVFKFLFLLLRQMSYIEMKWLLTQILSEFKNGIKTLYLFICFFSFFFVFFSNIFGVVNVPISQKSNKCEMGHVKGTSL